MKLSEYNTSDHLNADKPITTKRTRITNVAMTAITRQAEAAPDMNSSEPDKQIAAKQVTFKASSPAPTRLLQSPHLQMLSTLQDETQSNENIIDGAAQHKQALAYFL